jgi:hypothetical protein
MSDDSPVSRSIRSIEEAERQTTAAREALYGLHDDLFDLPALRRIVISMRGVSNEKLAKMGRITVAQAAALRRRAIGSNSKVRIDDCDTSLRFVNILSVVGVHTLGELAKLTVKDMAKIANSGSRMVKEGRELLLAHGLCFQDDERWLRIG